MQLTLISLRVAAKKAHSAHTSGHYVPVYVVVQTNMYVSLYRGFKSVYKKISNKVESSTNKVDQGKQIKMESQG